MGGITVWEWCCTLLYSPSPLDYYNVVELVFRLASLASISGYIIEDIRTLISSDECNNVQEPEKVNPELEELSGEVELPSSSNTAEILPSLNSVASLNFTNKGLLLVSTLDGLLSALGAQNGQALWHLATGPLLPSFISQIEVENQRESFRFFPSPDGEFSRCDLKKIKTVFKTVTDLLQPASHLNPVHLNSVVAGGKEVHSYGLDPLSGTQFFECSMTGCDKKSSSPDPKAPVLLVKRHTETAVWIFNSKTGPERWNCSVGYHEVVLLGAEAEDVIESCSLPSIEKDVLLFIPEGIIVMKDGNDILWKKRLASPIVQAWGLVGRELTTLFDMFENARSEPTADYDPASYIRLHCQQLIYAQPSTSQVHVREEPFNLHFNLGNFRSRYLDDFLHIQFLGKGGFGVVFEAKNKFDGCNYAVKCIRLPNDLDSREKVMREVKALAKLEHKHIVRYFQSWQEEPPPGWQEKFDQEWKENCEMSTSCTVGSNASSSAMYSNTTSVAQVSANISESAGLSSANLEDANSFDIVFEHESETQNKETETRVSSQLSESSSRSQRFDNSQVVPQSPVPQSAILEISSATQRPCVYLYIQMQLCLKESLMDWLQSHTNMRDPIDISRMFKQILSAIEYIHRQGLMHRDLKPSNIFFAQDGSVKVGDFGLVTTMVQGEEMALEIMEERLSGQNHTHEVGTKLYMSPEQLKGSVYDHKVDIYALAFILFEMLVPFSTQMERIATLQKVREQKYPDGFSAKHPDEHGLLCKMLANDPKERPTASDILENLSR